MRQGSRLVRPRTVTGDGDGLVSHAGVAWLAETADLSGLTAGLSAAMASCHSVATTPGARSRRWCSRSRRRNVSQRSRRDPRPAGRVRSGRVGRRRCGAPSIMSARSSCAAIAAARAAARARAWAAGAGPAGDEVIVDIDSTIIRTKTDKQDAAPTYKRTFGHHPLLAMCAETDEVLAGILRPGNAGANTAIDHVMLLADALAQLPRRVAHRPPDR